MKKKDKHYPLCKTCKGERVILVKTEKVHGDYYDVCKCSLPKEKNNL